MRVFVPLLLALLAMPLEASASSPIDLDALDEIVERGLEEEVYPGAVLVVGQPGRFRFERAYGRFTYDPESRPMTTDAVFDLASVSKVAGTATAAFLLLGDGLLSTDDEVDTYIPRFGSNGKESVTIHDLMTHTSGLKAYESRDRVEETRAEDEAPADALIRTYAALEPSYTPKEGYTYSCLNFQTLARVVENASGIRLEDLLRNRVYTPLGMTSTFYTVPSQAMDRVVPTLEKGDGSLLAGEVHDPLANYHGFEDHCPGNAGLFSSAPDIANWCEMILQDGKWHGRQIIDPDVLAAATQDQIPDSIGEDRGLGFDVYEVEPYLTPLNKTPETAVFGHSGYTGTLVWFDRLSGTYMVFFTNRVFPDDQNRSEKESIGSIRGALARAIQKSLPQYQEYFASQTADGG